MLDRKFKVAILISFTCLSLALIGSIVYGSDNLNATLGTLGTLDTSNWKNYSNALYGLKIKHPADWESTEQTETLFFYPSNDIENVNFGYFGINSVALVGNKTIQNILRDDMFSLKSSDIIKNVVTTEPNMTTLDNGVKIYQYQYTYETSGGTSKGFTSIAIEGGLKYSLDYAANSENFDVYIPIVKTIIKSFEPIGFEFTGSPAQ